MVNYGRKVLRLPENTFPKMKNVVFLARKRFMVAR